MPKRTNRFQKLVYVIQKTLEPGATVTESKFLVDKATNENVEVDIVIETSIGDYRLTLCVEVTGESRQSAGSEWLNEMYGKHKRLPTNKLILVSKSGFIKNAQKIVNSMDLSIQLMTFEEAEEFDWTVIVNKLRELFLTRLSLNIIECKPILTEEPELECSSVGPELILYDSQGNSQEKIGEAIYFALNDLNLTQEIYQRENRSNIDSFEGLIEATDDRYLIDALGVSRKIKGFFVKGHLKFIIDPISLTHKSFGSYQIAFGELNTEDTDILLTVIEKKHQKPTFNLSLLASKK